MSEQVQDHPGVKDEIQKPQDKGVSNSPILGYLVFSMICLIVIGIISYANNWWTLTNNIYLIGLIMVIITLVPAWIAFIANEKVYHSQVVFAFMLYELFLIAWSFVFFVSGSNVGALVFVVLSIVCLLVISYYAWVVSPFLFIPILIIIILLMYLAYWAYSLS